MLNTALISAGEAFQKKRKATLVPSNTVKMNSKNKPLELIYSSDPYFKTLSADIELEGRKYSINDRLIFVVEATKWDLECSIEADVVVRFYHDGQFQEPFFVEETYQPEYNGIEVLDANFDGLEDLVLLSYNGNGCCPRDSRDIYLSTGEGFSTSVISVFNPEFNNVNKRVYQMTYGHSPDADINRYRWAGDSLVLEETLTHSISQEDWKVDSLRPFALISHTDTSKALLTHPPEAYSGLSYFGWFTYYP